MARTKQTAKENIRAKVKRSAAGLVAKAKKAMETKSEVASGDKRRARRRLHAKGLESRQRHITQRASEVETLIRVKAAWDMIRNYLPELSRNLRMPMSSVKQVVAIAQACMDSIADEYYKITEVTCQTDAALVIAKYHAKSTSNGSLTMPEPLGIAEWKEYTKAYADVRKEASMVALWRYITDKHLMEMYRPKTVGAMTALSTMQKRKAPKVGFKGKAAVGAASAVLQVAEQAATGGADEDEDEDEEGAE